MVDRPASVERLFFHIPFTGGGLSHGRSVVKIGVGFSSSAEGAAVAQWTQRGGILSTPDNIARDVLCVEATI